MKRLDIVKRVRALTRDFSNSIFREEDIVAFINEGIERFQQIVPELENLPYLNDNEDVPTMIPTRYHHLLAVYSTSRCFGQDERHYQASTYMNEFEQKLDELKAKIEGGEVEIIDPETGLPIVVENEPDYVKNNYYFNSNGTPSWGEED